MKLVVKPMTALRLGATSLLHATRYILWNMPFAGLGNIRGKTVLVSGVAPARILLLSSNVGSCN